MTASLSDATSLSSLQKLFDKEMLQKLYIMIDRMQEKYEDKREWIKHQEKFIVMKEEKQEILENMHEMETQLHDAKEALAMHVMKKEVCNSSWYQRKRLSHF